MLVHRPYRPLGSRPSFAVDRSSSIDRAFAQLTGDLFAPARRTPEVDASWLDGSFVLTVDLPGVPAAAVFAELTDRTLNIAVRRDGAEQPSWQRSFRLGAVLDVDQLNARYVDGRLTVTVPEVAPPEARRITIDHVTTPAANSAAATDGMNDTDVKNDTDGSTAGEV